jgi:uncharacterized protein YecT (DUF1311 family)
MRALTAPALGCFLVTLTWAAPASADSAYSKCIDGTSSNVEWAGCGQDFLERLDATLNAAWKRAKASVDAKSQKDLLEEQRAWLKFRDSSCMMWANGSYGREGEVLHYFECRAGITEARISDLNGISEFMREHQ